MRDPRKAFEQKLVELGKENSKIFAVSCDSASGGGLASFFKEFPDRSIEVGISEQNGVSLCAAMSKVGIIPVLVIINPFLTMRAYEQVRDDLGYMNSNVKIVGSGGGLAYSTLGSTHIALEDIALMRTIPNLTIFAPGDAEEVEFALEQAVSIQGPVYIRMPRQARELPAGCKRNLQFGKAEILREGNHAAIFTYGPSADEAAKASDILAGEKIQTAVINLTTIEPLDEETIIKYIQSAQSIFTLEEHSDVGGIGTAVAEIMAEHGCPKPLIKFAVPKGAKQTGPYDELLDYYGLSARQVAKKIKEIVNVVP